MSAICGLLRWQGASVSAAELAAMHAALAGFGGDGGGLWCEAGTGLAQQLRMFTPQDEHERLPLHDAGRAQVLLWHGRLDNRQQLARQLTVRDEATLPDSALVLAAFQRWGRDCLARLTGVFAFALWESPAQQLHLVRSAISAPPLVWHATAALFAFASMPAGLFALPAIARRLNERKLADMLVQSPADAEATLYEGVQRLPTGCLLTVSGSGQVALQRFWNPDLQARLSLPHDDDYLQAFRELLDEVVGAQLRSRSPVGLLLSGGLDSSAIATSALPQLTARGARLAAYTSVPTPGLATWLRPGTYVDETPLVQAMAARHSGLDLHCLSSGDASFLDDVDAIFPWLERYVPNTSNRVWMDVLYRQAAADGVRVLLNGAQGNLSFSSDGDPLRLPWRELASLLRGGRGNGVALVRALARRLVAHVPANIWQAWRGHGLDEAAAVRFSHSPINPAFASQHEVGPRARAAGEVYGMRQRPDLRQLRLEALQLQDFGMFDMASCGRWGVDSRSPAADVRLAEFSLALPDEQLRYRGQARALVRRALHAQLPPEICGNPHRGLQAADWFARLTRLRPQLVVELDELQRHDLASRVLDLKRMRRMLECWPDPHQPVQRLAPYLLVLERGVMVGRFLRWLQPGRE